ncbi:hypothetical protein HDU97_006350 [Phlyctochytrium planicorne]|nr:hypothetical protein HDU97_006350 [Phlyctochytrium planicorne]
MSNNSSHRSRSSSSSSTDNNNNTNSNPVKRLNSKRPQNFINQAPRILASIAREEARAEASHSASTSTGGKAKKNLPKSKTQKALEAGRIPRPPNAFILYRIDKQKEVVEEMREYKLNSMDMSKAWAAKWKAESDEVKQTYKDRAVAIREALFQKHPEFTFKPWKRDAGMVKNSNGYFDSYDSRFHVTTMEDAATRGRKKKVAPPPKAGKRKGKKSRSPSTSDSDGGYFRRSLSPLTDEDTEMEESYPDQIFHDTRSQPADIDSSACNPTAFIPAEHPEALICEGSIMSAGNLFSSVPSNLGDSLLPEHNVGFQPLGEASMTASQVFHSESQMPFFSNPLGSGQDKQAFDSSAISNASLSMQVSMLPPPSTASQQFVFQQQDAEGRWIPLQVPSQIDPGVWKSVEELLGADGSFGEGASSMSFADVPFNAIKDYVPSFPSLLALQHASHRSSPLLPTNPKRFQKTRRTLNQTKWKRRFFILTQTSLLLFRSDAQDEKSISRLAINSTSDTMVSDEEGATGRYILEVRTEREAEGAAAKNEDEEASGPGPRIWRLLSENEDVIMGWLIAVQDVIEREQIKAVQSTGNPAPSASASATSTPPPPLSNASTPISTPPRVSSVKRNPVPLGPVLAMLETKPSSSSSQPGIIPSPSSSKMSSDSPYLAKTHIYPTATAATSQVPTAVHHLHHLNPVMDRRPSVNATVQVTSAVASAAAVPQPVFMHSRSGSHGAMMMPPPAQPQQFVHARTISAGQVPPPPHMMQQQGYHYQPQQPIYQPQPTTTLHTFNQTPTAMVTASTISPMMLNATSSLQATNISPTSPTMYSQTSSISSSGSDRVVGAGAGAFSSKYKEVGVTSSGSNSSKKSGGGMDDLMMGGGSSNGSGSSSKKERKKDAVKGMDALMGGW